MICVIAYHIFLNINQNIKIKDAHLSSVFYGAGCLVLGEFMSRRNKYTWEARSAES